MILVETLTVHEFRGIRDLTLKLNRKNFAICGPNGTGKSGIVDALEFVLAGTISRLTGRGRGELSIKTHGPHIDCSLPEAAYAEATVWVPSLGKSLTIRRTVKAPSAPTLVPDTPQTREVLAYLEGHPEFALSRREITNYVLAEPGQRSKDIQELLKLDAINTLRLRFQKIAREAAAAAKACAQTKAGAEDALARALSISSVAPPALLTAANAQRQVLGLEPVLDLLATTSLKTGVVGAAGETGPRLNKTVATSDVQALAQALARRSQPPFVEARDRALNHMATLQADEALLNAVVREDFLTTAVELFDGETCPACEAPYTAEAFQQIIARKRAKLAEVRALRTEAERLLAPLIRGLEGERDLLRAAWPHARALLPNDQLQGLTEIGTSLSAAIAQLQAFLPLDRTLAVLVTLSERAALEGVLGVLAARIAQLPEPSAREAAAEILTIAQERLDALRGAEVNHEAAGARAQTATHVFDLYLDQTETALAAIYDKVQGRFSGLYRQLNADDEADFEAEMKQDRASLDFKVDFYKRGKFPPGAYHSEGHQDSMGLCLYLALMSHLQDSNFTFAVLDDVLMSVDSGHRREVSRMLKTEFPTAQFVLTTHDEVWLKYMQTTGLIDSKNFVRFRKWSVETGPSVWLDADVWGEIESATAHGQIREAAGALRNYLEYVFRESCQAFRAQVTFNADGRYDLGDLQAPAINQLRKLFDDAAKAAESWSDQPKSDAIRARKARLEAAAKAALGEQWQINPAIHHNEWANFDAKDFAPVVAAFRELVAEFHCQTCGSIYEVVPPKGDKEHLLCTCGTTSLTFARKPKFVA